MPHPLSLVDMGYLLEGTIEQDPMDDRYRLRVVQNGELTSIDLQDLLAKYNGQDVRVIVSPLVTIQQLQDELEKQGDLEKGAVLSIQDFPGSTVIRKPG